MGQWKKTTLGNLVTFQRGHDLTASEFKGGHYPIIGSNGVIGYHDEFTTEPPSVTIGRSGNIGNAFLHTERIWAHNTTLYTKEFHKADPFFVYWIVKNLKFEKFNSGSAVPTLNRNFIHPIELLVPVDVDEQKSIAQILLSIEHKIKLLGSINETYIKIAKLTYRRWFHEYQFPDKNGRPYLSNGGKMVDSELGEIPLEWSVCKFGDILERISDRIGQDDQSKYVVLSAIKTGELIPSEDYFTKQVFSKDISKYIRINKDDFAYNPARINIGSIGKLDDDICGAVSPVYVAFRAKNNYTHFVSFLIKTQKTRRHIDYFANGSVRQALNYDDFAFMDIIRPSEEVVKKFDEIYEGISDEIKANNLQIGILTKMLNILMSKLLTGEIRVSA